MSLAIAGPDTDVPVGEQDVRSRRRDSWAARTERPLMVFSVLFILVLCAPVLWPHMTRWQRDLVNVANILIWAIFAIDFVVQVRLAESARRHIRHNLVDLVVVVVPFFRPLRLLRLFSISGFLARRTRATMLKEMTKFVCFATVATWFLGAVALLDVERGAPHTVVRSFPDALWLSCGTLTAVPYGDTFPVTQTGRVLCGFLMILGLVLVGALTGAIAAWMVTFVTGQGEEEDDAGAKHLASVLARLEEMEGRLVAHASDADRSRRSPRRRTATPQPEA